VSPLQGGAADGAQLAALHARLQVLEQAAGSTGAWRADAAAALARLEAAQAATGHNVAALGTQLLQLDCSAAVAGAKAERASEAAAELGASMHALEAAAARQGELQRALGQQACALEALRAAVDAMEAAPPAPGDAAAMRELAAQCRGALAACAELRVKHARLAAAQEGLAAEQHGTAATVADMHAQAAGMAGAVAEVQEIAQRAAAQDHGSIAIAGLEAKLCKIAAAAEASTRQHGAVVAAVEGQIGRMQGQLAPIQGGLERLAEDQVAVRAALRELRSEAAAKVGGVSRAQSALRADVAGLVSMLGAQLGEARRAAEADAGAAGAQARQLAALQATVCQLSGSVQARRHRCHNSSCACMRPVLCILYAHAVHVRSRIVCSTSENDAGMRLRYCSYISETCLTGENPCHPQALEGSETAAAESVAALATELEATQSAVSHKLRELRAQVRPMCRVPRQGCRAHVLTACIWAGLHVSASPVSCMRTGVAPCSAGCRAEAWGWNGGSRWRSPGCRWPALQSCRLRWLGCRASCRRGCSPPSRGLTPALMAARQDSVTHLPNRVSDTPLHTTAWPLLSCVHASSQEIEGLPANVEAVSGVVASLVSQVGPVEQTAKAVESRMSQLENTVAGALLSSPPLA
jgi:hypothetical protein